MKSLSHCSISVIRHLPRYLFFNDLSLLAGIDEFSSSIAVLSNQADGERDEKLSTVVQR